MNKGHKDTDTPGRTGPTIIQDTEVDTGPPVWGRANIDDDCASTIDGMRDYNEDADCTNVHVDGIDDDCDDTIEDGDSEAVSDRIEDTDVDLDMDTDCSTDKFVGDCAGTTDATMASGMRL